MRKVLHPHQTKAIEMLRDSLRKGKRRPILNLPTGAGKTVIAAQIIENAESKGKRVCFTVPAIELIDQTVDLLLHEGISQVGVIQADHEMTAPERPIQVCSVQTLMRRALPQFDLVLLDEAHKMFDFVTEWMAKPEWSNVPFIGLTATPYTRGLGRHFDDLLIPTTMQELIDGGFLSPFRVFAPSKPNLDGIKTVAGDYHEGQLSERMSDETLVGDAVQHWLEHGQDLPTLVFAVDRAHAKFLQRRFEGAGVACGYIDCTTEREERQELRRRFRSGELKVITNVGVLTTGVDLDVRVLVLCRPTKSRILYQQIIGRALRTAPGKEAAMIFDHSMTTLNLGFVTDLTQEHLDDGKERSKSDTDRTPLPKECPSCHYLRPPKVRECPACGFIAEHVPHDVKAAEGELIEVTPKTLNRKSTLAEKALFYGELRGYAQERGYNPKWADAKYREKFGTWPNDPRVRHAPARTPSRATRNWCKAQAIRWAKSQPKRAEEVRA